MSMPRAVRAKFWSFPGAIALVAVACGGRTLVADCRGDQFCAAANVCCPQDTACGTGDNGCPPGDCCTAERDDAGVLDSSNGDWDVDVPVPSPWVGGGGAGSSGSAGSASGGGSRGGPRVQSVGRVPLPVTADLS
jgi:hypothetical protein